ncbi:retinol dehydrogenase 13-like [Amphiura filiformis]|uniref:retinol dehydrogenase 13-like n=1 Tax=Amphiura filiformis TaxID=82378 RepID=UPI003B219D49
MLWLVLLFLVGLPALSLFVLRIWVQQSVVICSNNVSLKGKTVLVTGASAGIGEATALGLAKKGARVILGCRNVEKANAVKEYIQGVSGNKSVIVKHLDLASLKSIRRCAEEIINEEERLDVLINNAGLMSPSEKTITEDGLELTFASNYFGHFLLTNLLLGLLKKSGPSRIISVSSKAHDMGSLNLKDINFHQKNYHWGFQYGHTKLAINLFVKELSNRLKGTDVTVNAVHPGTCGSEIFIKQGNLFFTIFQAIGPLWWRTSEEGAQSSLYLATSDEVKGVSGEYFVDSAKYKASRASYDETKARRLWELSEQLTGL